jgi:hypothetical protein
MTFTELVAAASNNAASVRELRGWEFYGDDEVLVVKVGRDLWQLGIAGEQAPEDIIKHNWSSAFDPDKATAMVSDYLQASCQGFMPRNLLIVVSANDYAKRTWADWATFAINRIGFEGFLTVDSRHAMFYCSGRRTGVTVEIAQDVISAIALYDGYMIHTSHTVTPISAAFVPEDKRLAMLNDTITACIGKCPRDQVAELMQNVYVAGTGLLEAWPSREVVAQKTLDSMQKKMPKLEVKVILPLEYKYSSWIGGSVMAGLSVTHVAWVHNSDGAASALLCDDPEDEDFVELLRAIQYMMGRTQDTNGYWALMQGKLTIQSRDASGPSSRGRTRSSIISQLAPDFDIPFLTAPADKLQNQSIARQDTAEKARSFLMKVAGSEFRFVYEKPKLSFVDQLKDTAAMAQPNPSVGCGPLWSTHWGQPGIAPLESDFKFTPKYPAVPNCGWLGMPEPEMHSSAKAVEHTLWSPPLSALPPQMDQQPKPKEGGGWFGFGGRKRNESNRYMTSQKHCCCKRYLAESPPALIELHSSTRDDTYTLHQAACVHSIHPSLFGNFCSCQPNRLLQPTNLPTYQPANLPVVHDRAAKALRGETNSISVVCLTSYLTLCVSPYLLLDRRVKNHTSTGNLTEAFSLDDDFFGAPAPPAGAPLPGSPAYIAQKRAKRQSMLVQNGIVKTGTLISRSKIAKFWRERYFTLDRAGLKYYKQKGGPMKGEILLTTILDCHRAAAEEDREKEFTIILVSVDRNWHLAANSEKELKAWMIALQALLPDKASKKKSKATRLSVTFFGPMDGVNDSTGKLSDLTVDEVEESLAELNTQELEQMQQLANLEVASDFSVKQLKEMLADKGGDKESISESHFIEKSDIVRQLIVVTVNQTSKKVIKRVLTLRGQCSVV